MENSNKRVYTPEQKEARRIWQNERRRIINYEDYKKYYPKLKAKRQLKSLELKLKKLAERQLNAKKKLLKQKTKPVKVKSVKISAPIKIKKKEKRFETLKQDLTTMKKVFIKEMNMVVFVKQEQDEEKVREKYLKTNHYGISN